MSSIQTAPVPLTPPGCRDGPSGVHPEEAPPRKLPKRRNDVYVNMKTDFRAQLARCQKLLEGGGHRESAFTAWAWHSNRAINIALQLQASSQGALQLAANLHGGARGRPGTEDPDGRGP
ncbi:hypothetical protein FQN60_006210 [Etheostoma spectabile]|uniref:Uncharacterized protein n=1 Tax=Etheostoma spectabile TaxID=54343 RepID=A0A5J5CNM9_9PERO|nr:hypothetical protein FQN60_006210 [Etheostoma spectabile]